MILPVVSGAVDLSGVVAWLARAYDSTLAGYERRVTGDPGTLRQVAGGYRANADRVAGIAVELLSRSRSSGADWQGAAYQAFDGAVTRLGGRVDVTEHRLRRQATAVETAASALEQTSRTVGEVRAHFRSRAQLLSSCARAVPIWQLGGIIMQLHRYGRDAVAQARAAHDQLGTTLDTVAAELRTASGNDRPDAASAGSPQAARDAARTVLKALDGDAGPAEVRTAMAELRGVTDRVHAARTAGRDPAAADLGYLSAFYHQLGDRVFDLPGYIKAGEHEWDTVLGFFGQTDPGYAAADQASMMATLGNGIVELSHHPDQLSPEIRDLVTTPAGTTEVGAWPTMTPSASNLYQAVGIPHLDRFEAMRDMLTAADPALPAGTEFSAGLTQRVGEMAEVTGQLHDPTNQIGDDRLDVVPEQAGMHDKAHMDTMMGDLLGVSTRNTAADASLMTDAATLRRLAGYEWTDDGVAAGKLVDWIPSALASSDPAAQQLARESYLGLAETVTDTTPGTGADDSAGGAGDGKEDGTLATMLRGMSTNEALSTEFARLNSANIGLFGNTDGPTGTSPAQLSATDARHMVMLGGYSQDGRDLTTAAALAYQQHELQLAADVPPDTRTHDAMVTSAGERAGNVMGLTTAGIENAIWDEAAHDAETFNAERQQQYERQLALAHVVKDLGKEVAGKLPVFGVVYDHSVEAAIKDALPGPEPVPPSVPADQRHETQLHVPSAGKVIAAYDIAAHEYARDPSSVPAEALVRGDGTVRVASGVDIFSQPSREAVVEWARTHPTLGPYVDGYHTQAYMSYDSNIRTDTAESIGNDTSGANETSRNE